MATRGGLEMTDRCSKSREGMEGVAEFIEGEGLHVIF